MNLTGEKVILRTMEKEDRDMFSDLIKDPDTGKITGGYGCPLSYDRQMDWFGPLADSAGGLRRVIADRECPQKALGVIALSDIGPDRETGELYIKVVKSARRKGFGEDAVRLLISYGFGGLGLNCVESHILERNIASRRLFEKCGFRLEETCRSSLHGSDVGEKVCCYRIWADRSPESPRPEPETSERDSI